MGYYSGSGVTSGGASEVNVFAYYMAWGAMHTIYQRRTSETVRKSGVALSTAKGSEGVVNMSDHQFASGQADAYLALQSKGSKTSHSYSQIANSNLYELNSTTETFAVKKDSGGWQT